MDAFLAQEEWFKQSWYDYETAHAMFQSGRFIYTVFMCHLAIEKALKGLFQKNYQKVPFKTHDLIYPKNLAYGVRKKIIIKLS